MNEDIEKFISADTEDENTENIIPADKNIFSLSNIFSAILIIGVFIITATFGVKLQNQSTVNQLSPKIDITETEEKITDGKSDISSIYKVKDVIFPRDDSNYKRGLLNITKEDFKSLEKNELYNLFEYLSELNEYSWITLNFEDGTGIVTYPGNKSTYLYGFLNDYGQVSYITGAILKSEKEGFEFIVNSTYADSEKQTDNAVTKITSEKSCNTTEFSEISFSETENTSDSNESNIDNATAETVYITASGTKYHRNNCSYLSKSKISISLSKAVEQGYSPCSRCNK